MGSLIQSNSGLYGNFPDFTPNWFLFLPHSSFDKRHYFSEMPKISYAANRGKDYSICVSEDDTVSP